MTAESAGEVTSRERTEVRSRTVRLKDAEGEARVVARMEEPPLRVLSGHFKRRRLSGSSVAPKGHNGAKGGLRSRVRAQAFFPQRVRTIFCAAIRPPYSSRTK